jgi:pimeloyl-ACP methyl ester carboxylesterase
MNANSLSPAAEATTQHVTVNGASVAFRSFGAGKGPPLVLLQRFRGVMNHWDPDLLDRLAAERRVIVFDNHGVGLSDGQTPDSIAGMARGAAGFIEAMGLKRVDLLGWSMGGIVAQQLCLDRPDLVRRAILAGSSPGGVADAPKAPELVWKVATKPVNDDDDFLYLFFHDSNASLAAGREHLRRLKRRDRKDASSVGPESIRAQLTAVGGWAAGKDSALPRLGEIEHPIFVANGQFDRMIPAYNSYVMAQGLPHAKLTLYPDSGHGFLFQHTAEFANDVLVFLAD